MWIINLHQTLNPLWGWRILSISTPGKMFVLWALACEKVKNYTLLARFPEHSVTTRKQCKRLTLQRGEYDRDMLMRHCIAVGCTSDSRKDKDVRFFQLPKVEWILKRWLNLIRREDLNVDSTVDNRHNVACLNHFVDGCPTFKNPLPTLFVFNILKQKHS